jgi:hypothetical protein
MEPMVWGAGIILSFYCVYKLVLRITGSADKAKKSLWILAVGWLLWTWGFFIALSAAVWQIIIIIGAAFGWNKLFDNHNKDVRAEVQKVLQGTLRNSTIEVIVKEASDKSIVKAEEHIHEMYKAIRTAKKGVFISSGWASSNAITPNFITEVSNVLSSGINVTLVYGLEGSQYSKRKEPGNLKADEALNSLHERSKSFPGTLRLWMIPEGNHAKVVIRDLEYCIVGSYDFLSNMQNAKHELSVRIDSPVIVKQILRDFELHVEDMVVV